MRLVLFVCLALFCGFADEAFAQAGTGGTQDGPAASGMIYPVRPRVGPAVNKPPTQRLSDVSTATVQPSPTAHTPRSFDLSPPQMTGWRLPLSQWRAARILKASLLVECSSC